MANLKGGTFEKQLKDAFHRLEAFGVSRVGKNDNLTHSDKLAEKREMYLKDVTNFFKSQNLTDKLNTLFTKENLDRFFNQRLENLSSKTKENYLRGFSSMLQGLEQKNIYIPLHLEDKGFFDYRVKIIKDEADTIIENRYINNVDDVIKNLYEIREISGLIAQTQYELSIRQAEAFELVKNPLKYIDNGFVNDLVGKGNHKYEQKEISFELEQKLLNNQSSLIDKSTYYNDLQKFSISSHDFRFTAARDKFEEKLKNGISEKEAKLQISQELNHKREAITDYYLKRTM
ncbi:hypothetical protein [Aliarcobacter skirrowii]|uniref:hypothetical protein n=2 Tax=Aliarcobacter skirrowii TaxID=28200 RepID=UPI000D61E094|nr:hypothetical protein [Aliarcobacter skirrowii]PWE19942.1 hypothetical protein DGF29_07620 [Aliarcobacter skirrowii]RJO55491.1 hypothetical protein DIR39_07625 [Aliarcobacter skirrowii]RJO57446.1 hypothetical protein DIR38_07625 [Aliarcobacter skirrowii]